MKIDIDAFLKSLPIMGVGLLGIFIVTIVLIIGIYALKAITAKAAEAEAEAAAKAETEKAAKDGDAQKTSAKDLLDEKKKTDFLETEDSYSISRDL